MEMKEPDNKAGAARSIARNLRSRDTDETVSRSRNALRRGTNDRSIDLPVASLPVWWEALGPAGRAVDDQ